MNIVSQFARYINDKIGQSNALAYFVFKVLPSNEILLGKEYRKIKKNIDINALPQNKKLQTMLSFAKQNVPYYENINSTHYNDFPLIDKKTIAENGADFFSNTYTPLDYELITSAGTSGVPAKYYSKKKDIKKNMHIFIFYERR